MSNGPRARGGGRGRRGAPRSPTGSPRARLERRRPGRAGRADERLDVPLRRPRRTAARIAQPDPNDDELGRPVPHAGRRGRARDRLAGGGLAAPRASTPERMEELSRQSGWAKTFGLPLELISAEEAQRLFPPMTTEGVLGAAYLPSDGYIDPSQLTLALAEGARRGGAEIYQQTRVTALRSTRSREMSS